MNRLRLFLSNHRALTFCVITFAITWTYEFAVVYPLVGNANILTGASTEAMLAIGAAMFFPTIGVVLTRFVTGQGFKDLYIKPLSLRRSLKWFVFAWFAPSMLIAFGAVIYYYIFPGDFDPACPGLQRAIDTQGALTGEVPDIPISAAQLALAQIALGVSFGKEGLPSTPFNTSCKFQTHLRICS